MFGLAVCTVYEVLARITLMQAIFMDYTFILEEHTTHARQYGKVWYGTELFNSYSNMGTAILRNIKFRHTADLQGIERCSRLCVAGRRIAAALK